MNKTNIVFNILRRKDQFNTSGSKKYEVTIIDGPLSGKIGELKGQSGKGSTKGLWRITINSEIKDLPEGIYRVNKNNFILIFEEAGQKNIIKDLKSRREAEYEQVKIWNKNNWL